MVVGTCPKCGSENTQRIKIMMESNTKRGTSVSLGTGIGLSADGGLGLGAGSAISASVTQTDLVLKYELAREPKRSIAPVIFGAFFLLFALIAYPGAWIWGTIWLVFGGLCIARFIGRKKEVITEHAAWTNRKTYLESAWVCHRCGEDWDPAKQPQIREIVTVDIAPHS